MIYENGYIQAIETEQGRFDDKGRPVFSDAVECELIPCMFRSSVNDKRGTYKDGGYSRYAYEVHLEPVSVTAKRAKLYREDGSLIGEFTIQSWEYARILNFTQIILG